MKNFLLAAGALFCAAAANAATSGISDVQPKGGFNLGVQLGVPPCGGVDANMPNMSVDANWTVASGMFNAGKFGQNGAIDLGPYYGICSYDNIADQTFFQHTILVRGAFHFEFVPKLDVYAGVFGGANVYSGDGWSNGDACVGAFIGAKYFFNDVVGVKAEFGGDVVEGNYAPVAAGVAFKF